MSTIISQAQDVAAIVQNHALAAWQRASQAHQALSGLMLSDLNDAAAVAVEAELVAVNRMTAAYDDIATWADYEQLTDSDAAEMLDHLESVTRICIESETERVMKELAARHRRVPVAAIEQVRQHPDIFTPLLIQSLKQGIAAVRNGEDPDIASFFAAFLLVELEVDEAFPVLLEAIRLPGEGPFELLGDAIHDHLAPFLALFSRGNTDEIAAVVDDTNVNLYVRWSTAATYKQLVRDGNISRSEAIDALHRHFQNSVESGDEDLLAPLACELGDLAAEVALETLRSAYARHLVDESIVDLAFIESQIAAGEQTVMKALEYCRPTGMPDTIEELSGWAGFQEAPKPKPKQPIPPPAHIPAPHLPFSDIDPPATVTAVRGSRKVGRNDPCPCGSGKKFKKCCR